MSNEQTKEALSQVNDIRNVMNLPALDEWPTEPMQTCEVCDAQVPESHIKGTGYFDSDREIQFDGPAACRKCRNVEGSEDSEWCPVDEALGLVIDAHDFFYFRPKHNEQAMMIAQEHPGCDLINTATDRPISERRAREVMDGPDAEWFKLGVAFQETLNVWIREYFDGDEEERLTE